MTNKREREDVMKDRMHSPDRHKRRGVEGGGGTKKKRRKEEERGGEKGIYSQCSIEEGLTDLASSDVSGQENSGSHVDDEVSSTNRSPGLY